MNFNDFVIISIIILFVSMVVFLFNWLYLIFKEKEKEIDIINKVIIDYYTMTLNRKKNDDK